MVEAPASVKSRTNKATRVFILSGSPLPSSLDFIHPCDPKLSWIGCDNFVELATNLGTKVFLFNLLKRT
jgi:hypothetical protein